LVRFHDFRRAYAKWLETLDAVPLEWSVLQAVSPRLFAYHRQKTAGTEFDLRWLTRQGMEAAAVTLR
jgi:hypothetical protein